MEEADRDLDATPQCSCRTHCHPRERSFRGWPPEPSSDFDRWLDRFERRLARSSALFEYEQQEKARQYADQLVACCQPLRSGPGSYRTSDENRQRRGPKLQAGEEHHFDPKARLKRLNKNLEMLDLCAQLSIEAANEMFTVKELLE